MESLKIVDVLGINESISPIKITEYIGEEVEPKAKLRNILGNDKNYYLIAPTNSGKTYSIMDISYKEKIKTVVIVPLQIIARQNKKNYEENYPGSCIGAVHGDIFNSKKEIDIKQTSDEEIKQYSSEEFSTIFCVYDSIGRLLKNMSPDKLKLYTLVVDEFHNLVTQYNFRSEAIKNINRAIPKFKKCVYVSGTPEGTIIEKGQDYIEKVHFKKKRRSKRRVTIYNYKNKTSDEDIYNILIHIRKSNYEGKVVVFIDNFKKLKKLNFALKHFCEGKVTVLNSAHKDDEDYINLVNEGVIPKGTKYLLVTRLLSDGANINNKNIDAIYILDIPDPLLKRQFIGRFRKSINAVYEFIHAKNSSAEEVFNIQEIEQECIESMDKIKKLKFGNMLPDKRNNNKPEDIYFDSNKGQYVISLENVRYNFLNRFNENVLQNNTRNLKEYYESIAKFEVTLENFESWKNANNSLIQKKEFMESIPDNFDCISFSKEEFIGDFRDLLTAYILLKQSFELQKNSYVWDILSRDFDVLSYYSNNKQYFNSRGCIDKIFNKVLKFITDGYTYDFIIQLVDKLFDKMQSNFVDNLYDKMSFYLTAQNYKEEIKLNISKKLKTPNLSLNEVHKSKNLNSEIVENITPELRDRFPIQSNSIKEIYLVRFIIKRFKPGDNFNYTNARKEFADYYRSKWGELGKKDSQFRFLMESIFDYTHMGKRIVNDYTLRNSKKNSRLSNFLKLFG